MGRTLKFDRDLKSKFIKLLKAGNTISAAAHAVGVSYDTIMKHRHGTKGKYFNDRIKLAMRSRVDVVEDALYTRAKNGNVTASIFFLVNRTRHMPADERYEHVQHIKHSGAIETNEESIATKIINNPEAAQLAVELLEKLYGDGTGKDDPGGTGNLPQ